ncbi:unnamed protein product, partial [Ectocarpus sp. 4 AP-2014]
GGGGDKNKKSGVPASQETGRPREGSPNLDESHHFTDRGVTSWCQRE